MHKNSNTYGIPDLHFNCWPLGYHSHYLQDFEHISEGSSEFEKAITGIKKPASGAGFSLFGHVYRIIPIKAITGIGIIIVMIVIQIHAICLFIDVPI